MAAGFTGWIDTIIKVGLPSLANVSDGFRQLLRIAAARGDVGADDLRDAYLLGGAEGGG